MKPAEDFLADHGITEETLAGDYAEVCLAMRLYSDQQNKELRESLTAETNRANALRDRLKQEHDDLVKERANGRIEWERLRADDKAEIQRLTKEVDELKKELAIERDDNEDLRRSRDSFRAATFFQKSTH